MHVGLSVSGFVCSCVCAYVSHMLEPRIVEHFRYDEQVLFCDYYHGGRLLNSAFGIMRMIAVESL